MRFIGLTGGIGSGKSEMAKYLEENYDSRIISADKVAHDMTEPGGSCYDKARALFATDDVWNEDGTFDRAKLAKVLFFNKTKRHALDAHIIPAIKAYAHENAAREWGKDEYAEMEWRKEAHTAENGKRDEYELLVLEIPLPITLDYWNFNYMQYYIYTAEETRRQRLKENRNYSDELIDAIIAAQPSEEVYREKCVQVIDNNGPIENAFHELDSLLEPYLIYPREKAAAK